MKKFVCALVVTLGFVGFSLAAEFTVTINKVDGSNVTYTKKEKAEKGKKATGKGIEVAAKAKDGVTVVNGKFGKGDDGKFALTEGDKIEGGLTNAMFKDIGEKGITARITTSDDDGKEITKIVVMPAFGKKKDTSK